MSRLSGHSAVVTFLSDHSQRGSPALKTHVIRLNTHLENPGPSPYLNACDLTIATKSLLHIVHIHKLWRLGHGCLWEAHHSACHSRTLNLVKGRNISGQNVVERSTAKCLDTCFYLSSEAINSSQVSEDSVEADIALFLWASHALYIVSICWVTIYIIREMFKCVHVMISGDS